jgi:hypothetical protein
MKARLATLLLTLAAAASSAANLPPNVSLHSLHAARDPMLGQTTISARLTNQGRITLPAPVIHFTLYDPYGREVGRVTQRAETDLPPGGVWAIQSSTPLTFTRFVPSYGGLIFSDAPLPAAGKSAAPRRPAAAAGKSGTGAAATAGAGGGGTGTAGTGTGAEPKKPAPAAAAKPAVQHQTEPSKPVLYDWNRRRAPSTKAEPPI